MGKGVALGAAFGLAVMGAAALAQNGSEKRPRIVSEEQYYCLVRHADTLEVSKTGAVVDITRCPPEVRVGLMPPTLSERFIHLTQADIACLKRGRSKGHNIAFPRPGKRVALFLRPCGRN